MVLESRGSKNCGSSPCAIIRIDGDGLPSFFLSGAASPGEWSLLLELALSPNRGSGAGGLGV